MRSEVLLVAPLFAVLFLSCNSTHQVRSRDTQSLKIPAAQTGPPLPPSICRIVGTVVSVDSVLMPASSGDPCSKAPCGALVRVDSVLGYGAAFPQPLTPGETVHIRFTFALGPTATFLPSVSPAFPGLTIGARFKADMEGIAEPVGPSGGSAFVVGTYEVR